MNARVAGSLSRWFATLLAAATLTAVAVASGIDATKSEIAATFRQMNVPVEGRFKIFHGVVNFDPVNLTAARARIEIDTASFDLGAPEYEEELRGKEWFDTSAYPKASFISSGVVAVGPNRFEAKGKFTLKGKTQEIKVPFTRRSDGGVQVYEGELPISRKAYAIGSAEWDDTLEDKVIVKFRITAAK
ncbi:YceI family protein [Sulfuricaulis sp.]|jgi:polyisoprenoid-binding protein YceI|uniref:YceI family protein n=1 Tax=Sulfuricaulis sp. TaxID=2003553 RepID=UPI0035594472